MVRLFKEIYDIVDELQSVRLAVVNPIQRYLLETIEDAEKKNWIKSLIFKSENTQVASQEAVSAVNDGRADFLMKGDVDTATLLKAVMDEEKGLKAHQMLSHIAVVESPNYKRLMLMTDGGVNIKMNKAVLINILENALILASRLQNNLPNVAFLSLVETISKKLPETGLAKEMDIQFKNNGRFTAEGPLALDVALSEKAALAKGISSRIAGKTDIFIGPNITAVNFMVKSLMAVGGSGVGVLIMGAQCPVVLLSRSDSQTTKLNSIALGCLALKGEGHGY